jgi:hypothetical protein
VVAHCTPIGESPNAARQLLSLSDSGDEIITLAIGILARDFTHFLRWRIKSLATAWKKRPP